MARPPRKSSSRRKPAASSPAAKEDLFIDAPGPADDADKNGIKEDWSLDEIQPKAIPIEPMALPTLAELPAVQEDLPPMADPEPSPLPTPPDAPEEVLPKALPISFPSPKPAPNPVVPEQDHDPFEIADELPVVAEPIQFTGITPVAAPDFQPEDTEDPSLMPSPELDGASLPPSRRNPRALIAAAAVLVVLPALFVGILYSNRPTGDKNQSRPAPRLPLAGEVATLPSIESGWRSRQPGDLVSTVEITLPVPSRKPSELLPEVKFTLDPATTKTGFLRFIFLDPDRKISGDVRVLKVNGSAIEPLGSGAIVSGPTATVYGSLGFMDRPGFVAYATGSSTRWSVEISESTTYNAKEGEWSKLETFDLRNASAP